MHQTYSYHQNILIHCREEEERKSMKQLIPDLPMKSFLRISAGCIVNIRYILEVRDTRVIMKDGKYFSVPANRIQQVKKEFGLKKVRYGMV